MTTAQAPRNAARETAATSARKPLWMFASCPPSVASARRCSNASSTMLPLTNVSGSSMAAVLATRTILNLKTSVLEPAGSPKGAPNCWLEQRQQNHQIGFPTQLLSWSPDSATEMGTEQCPQWLNISCLHPPPPHMPLHTLCVVCRCSCPQRTLPHTPWAGLGWRMPWLCLSPGYVPFLGC